MYLLNQIEPDSDFQMFVFIILLTESFLLGIILYFFVRFKAKVHM